MHRTLRGAGEESLLAGGAVRDHLLRRAPKDFDIASSATPEKVAALFPRTVLVGAQFGVAKVLVQDEEVEVVTFRTDLDYADGRHPTGVCYSTAAEDAVRRDFTINGLFYDLDEECVIDYVGGLRDLAARRLRAIGDASQRFREDRLRMMRAIRFATVLGFAIEESTWEALMEQAHAVTEVSGERIRDELQKILVHPRRELGYFLLSDSGLMQQILPEVEAGRDVPQPPEFHPEGDVHRHTGMVLAGLQDPSVELAFATLLHDIGKAVTFSVTDRYRFNRHDSVGARMAERICERLRLSKKQREEIVFLVKRHMILPALPGMRVAKRKRLFEEEHFAKLLPLGRADCLGSHGDTSSAEAAAEMYEDYLREGPPTEPILRGRHLLAAGYPKGPQMGEILRAVEDARREGEVSTEEEALAWIAERFEAPGGSS